MKSIIFLAVSVLAFGNVNAATPTDFENMKARFEASHAPITMNDIPTFDNLDSLSCAIIYADGTTSTTQVFQLQKVTQAQGPLLPGTTETKVLVAGKIDITQANAVDLFFDMLKFQMSPTEITGSIPETSQFDGSPMSFSIRKSDYLYMMVTTKDTMVYGYCYKAQIKK